MTTGQIVFAIVGLVVPLVAAVLITRHYTRRSIRKRLAVFLVSASSVFRYVDDSVLEALQVSFQGRPVQELWHVELIVANLGDTAIGNYREPLSLRITGDVHVLDASITATDPKDLGAGVNITETEGEPPLLRFTFPLLNKGDWFRVKLLLDGDPAPAPSDWEMRIRAENVPSTVPVRPARISEGKISAPVHMLHATMPLGGGMVGALLGIIVLQHFEPFVFSSEPLINHLFQWLAMVGVASVFFLGGITLTEKIVDSLLDTYGPFRGALVVGRASRKVDAD